MLVEWCKSAARTNLSTKARFQSFCSVNQSWKIEILLGYFSNLLGKVFDYAEVLFSFLGTYLLQAFQARQCVSNRV